MDIYSIKPNSLAISTGKISYLKIGQGTPLILINGFGNHYRDWNSEFVNELAKKFELYLVNNRGVGHSDSQSKDDTLAGIAKDITQLIESLPTPSFVLGHSMGGYLAQEVALAVPQKIAGLVLMSTRMGGRFKTMADRMTIEDLTQHYSSRWEETEALLKYCAPTEFHEKLRNHFRQLEELKDISDIRIPPQVKDSQNRARIQWLEEFGDQHLEYRKFRFPTLILAGNEDRIIPIQNSFELVREIPYSSLVRFPNGGHGLHHQFPRRIAKLCTGMMELL